MVATNSITGDRIVTKPSTSYADNYEAIFKHSLKIPVIDTDELLEAERKEVDKAIKEHPVEE